MGSDREDQASRLDALAGRDDDGITPPRAPIVFQGEVNPYWRNRPEAGKPLPIFDVKISLETPTFDRVRADLQKAFVTDVEGKLRQALIDMGWTPPAEK